MLNKPSPNFGERKPVAGVDGISMLVVHYTGMETCAAALDRLCEPGSDVSAHILIDEDGTAHRLVADTYRAWHAGAAFWRGISDINSVSIGIELVNPGHEYGYRAFPDAQMDALIHIASQLIEQYDIPAWGIVGHSDVAPGRKSDPGELFPWSALAAAGIGIWPTSTEAGESDDPWADLQRIGYPIPGDAGPDGGVLAPDTGEEDVIAAFQRRFRASDTSGRLDPQTRCLIRAVAETLS